MLAFIVSFLLLFCFFLRTRPATTLSLSLCQARALSKSNAMADDKPAATTTVR